MRNRMNRQYSEIDDSFESNCNKAIAYLKYLEEQYQGEIDTAKGIIYVYCWLYDVEFNKAQYNKNGINIYKKFLNEYTLIESMSNIPGIFQTYLKGNIDENLKNLYDLYYKFDKFKNKVKCENSYCKCAEECSNIYKKYKQEKCGNDDNTDFCKELHNFERHYNDYLKAHNTCDGNSYIRVILFPILITSIISFIVFFLFKVTNKFNLNKYKINTSIK
ncbi:hypothetical protein PVIIG_05250 [Plasmodium vivax India VII]|uniref:Uncharacterized protein n=1 Tax=Plasmodium vivax India VII TaxID=1077284 RepID=A0A0J9SIV7_PLAVI|nr:hypothetical protein PVIIG_05250 [Plasmodium vivax India VII]